MKILISLSAFILMGFLTSSSISADVKKVEGKHYSFEIPVSMVVEPELNASAIEQYSYVETVDNAVLELYVILIEETHKEIKSYKLDFEFTALSYWNLAAESLVAGVDDFQIITKDLKIETINGMDCVQGDIFGRLGDIKVVYRLGVYKSNHAFYQILTWTIAEQRPRFKSNMEQIVNSFKQK